MEIVVLQRLDIEVSSHATLTTHFLSNSYLSCDMLSPFNLIITWVDPINTDLLPLQPLSSSFLHLLPALLPPLHPPIFLHLFESSISEDGSLEFLDGPVVLAKEVMLLLGAIQYPGQNSCVKLITLTKHPPYHLLL